MESLSKNETQNSFVRQPELVSGSFSLQAMLKQVQHDVLTEIC
jgi:hypothetical protein